MSSQKISGLSAPEMCLFFPLFDCLLAVAGEVLGGGVGDDGSGVLEGGGGRAGLGTSAAGGWPRLP